LCKKSVTNKVIHQKKRLNINQPRKLWPLFLAIVAGKKASAIQTISRIMDAKMPKPVMSANI